MSIKLDYIYLRILLSYLNLSQYKTDIFDVIDSMWQWRVEDSSESESPGRDPLEFLPFHFVRVPPQQHRQTDILVVFKLHLTLTVFCPVPLFAKHSKYGEIIVLLEITVREHSLSSLLFPVSAITSPNRRAARQERSL